MASVGLAEHLEACQSGQDVEVAVEVEDGEVGPQRDSGDEAVVQRTNSRSRAPALPVQDGGLLVVGEPLDRYQVTPGHQAAQSFDVMRIPAPGQELHDDDLGGLESRILFDQTSEAAMGSASRSP